MTRRMVMAATLALSIGAVSLLAQGPGSGQRPGGPGRGPGGPGAPGGPGGAPGILGMVNHLEDLTDAQREQLRALAEEARKAGDPGEAMRTAEQNLHAAVFADTVDLHAIEVAKAAVNAAHAAQLDNRVAMMLKVAQILTPAQRKEL